MFTNNVDFYPTPNALIKKMLNKIDFRYINSVLEPSAGRGDLVEEIKKEFDLTRRYRNTKKYDIDTIEIDTSLQHILKGKGYRIVHDDFLTYNSFKRYDLIIANFPFSQGDKHLLKAIELQQKGGRIVALINADTLKNPYSNIRKDLIRKLEEHDAEVEFIEKAFLDADRKTDVTVALVYIDIPKSEYNSVILNELSKEEIHQEKTSNNDKLIHSDFIEGIVQQYNYEVKAGLRLIEEYMAMCPYMLRSFKGDSNPVLKLELEYKDDESSLENAYIKQIRSKYWNALFSNEQFMGLFTSNLKRKYMELVGELEDYDFSFYNIYTIRIQLSKEMVQGVEDTILNLFDEFSHKHYYDESSKNVHLYNGWRTNKAYKINKKVIIPLNGFYDISYSWGRFNPTSYRCMDKLQDIEKVFNYLDDGTTEDIDLKESLKFAEHYNDTKKIELKYFYVSFYKKGTCHIEFKYPELLHKFNLFGSQRKGWLPPSYGKSRYKDMTREEKEVINQFEGESSYNKVMNNQSYYLVKTEELLALTS
ncbi:DUF4942 domain-containing protein [Robertmurraya siralis]|uniref:DUF4942 domain-containing protein n=1 Tax=Robertmurraya siralis TaxID=77777 RepID=UPI0010F56025|nr:DUF4942 domain-containing protein [Robertmurraya siralis]